MTDLKVAVSENGFRRSFALLKDNLLFMDEGDGSYGGSSLAYNVEGQLEGGSVDLRDDNTVQIAELDIRWSRFLVTLVLDLPQVCVGGGCFSTPAPFPDICLPSVCVFTDNPDVLLTKDIAPYVAQEVSFTGSVDARYWDPSAAANGFDPCELLGEFSSEQNSIEPFPPDSNQWHIFIDPQTIDIDFFDFPDIVGDLFEDALNRVIQAIVPAGAIGSLVLQMYGDIADLLRFILDIPDDFEEWLSDLFNTSFGLVDVLGTVMLDFFGSCVPIYRIDDPFEVLAETDGLISVKAPIDSLDVRVDDFEMVINVDIGA